MATTARRKLIQTEDTRARIQAALIINRLHSCVMGEIQLDAQQVTCAKTLLNKVLPDLQNVALTGDENKGPVKIEIGWLSE